MNIRIAIPALVMGLALTAAPALAQRATTDRRAGHPVDRPPVNVHSCSLSRSCAPGPYITIVIDKSHTKVRRAKQPPSFPGRRR
jgi:hypothetical protein